MIKTIYNSSKDSVINVNDHYYMLFPNEITLIKDHKKYSYKDSATLPEEVINEIFTYIQSQKRNNTPTYKNSLMPILVYVINKLITKHNINIKEYVAYDTTNIGKIKVRNNFYKTNFSLYPAELINPNINSLWFYDNNTVYVVEMNKIREYFKKNPEKTPEYLLLPFIWIKNNTVKIYNILFTV